jgi:hypothetical protein
VIKGPVHFHAFPFSHKHKKSLLFVYKGYVWNIDKKGYRWAKVLSSSFCACLFRPFWGYIESKLIVMACGDASVIRGIFRVRNGRTRKILIWINWDFAFCLQISRFP